MMWRVITWSSPALVQLAPPGKYDCHYSGLLLCFAYLCVKYSMTYNKCSTFNYCNSLNYELPNSQLSRLQQIQNSVARTVFKAHMCPVISLPSYAVSTGSESMNASNTSSSHLPTKFSQLPIITPSLFKVLAVLALHPSLLLLGYRHHLL